MFHFSNKIKNKRFLFILIPVLFIFLIIPREIVWAGAGEWIANFLLGFLALMLAAFAQVSTFLMNLGGDILAVVITSTFNEGLFIKAPFVQIAWGFTRDFANLFFILWLVIIALSTIVGYKDYAAKKLLVRLIAIALLVNFSLVLCGFFLDVSQGLMGFLTQGSVYVESVDDTTGQMVGEPYSLSEGLTRAFKSKGLFGTDSPSGSEFFGGDWQNNLNKVIHNMLILIFGLVGAYAFIIMAVMLLTRIAAIWILLILSPLALVASIMPFAMKAYKEWLSNFFKWAFYGVVVAFFLYLAAMAVWAIDQAQGWNDRFQVGDLIESSNTQISFLNDFSNILSFLVVIILLMMAKNFGIKAAKSGGDILTAGITGFIGGKVSALGDKGKAWGKKPFQWAGGKTKEKAEQAKEWGRGKAGGLLMRGKDIPGLGGVVARRGGKMKAKSTKAKEERVSKAFDYSGLSEKDQLATVSTLKGDELEKMMKEMIKNDTIQKLDKENDPKQYEALQRMYKIAQKPGNDNLLKDFERKRFDMITDPSSYNLNKREMVQVAASNDPLLEQQIKQQKQQRAEDRSKEVLEEAVKKGEFKNEDFVNNLSTGQLTEVLKNKDATKAIGKAAEDWTQSVKDSVLNKKMGRTKWETFKN